MALSPPVMNSFFLGTDSGATTSKTCGVWETGEPITLKLSQSSTKSEAGTEAVVKGWVEGAQKFLDENNLSWTQVKGVGLALPGPYQSYGVLDRTPNLPASFAGWNFYKDYHDALKRAAGREIPLIVGNDGNLGGVGEAARARGEEKVGVILLAPGSGLGGAYVSPDGLALDGDAFCGAEFGHMPVPLQLFEDLPAFQCGCGRSWGCFESYTAIAGLPQYLEWLLPKYPEHPLATSPEPIKKKVLSLRDLAQNDDRLACEIFDLQARILGIHVANLSIAFDARYVVIGGGLIDPHSTTPEFRNRYMDGIRRAAEPWLYPKQRETLKIVEATLGELSQSIGAALSALYSVNK